MQTVVLFVIFLQLCLVTDGGVAKCLGNDFLEPSLLRRKALQLESHSQSPGKTQWIFPNIEFTCQTTISAIYFATIAATEGNKHPKFQIWRTNSSRIYNLVDEVKGDPTIYDENATGVYLYSGLELTVMPGDILGAYQPDSRMSKTFLTLRDFPQATSYFLTEQMKPLRSFDVNRENVEDNNNTVPLAAIVSADPSCVTDSGILRVAVLVQISQFLQLPPIGTAQHTKQQRIYPNVEFGCRGRITRIMFAALESPIQTDQEDYAELQLWKEDQHLLYSKVRSISLAEAVKTDHLNVYTLDDFVEPVIFTEGDRVGLYLPSQQNSRLILQFQQATQKEVNNASLSYSSIHYEDSNEIFNLTESHVVQNFDTPLIVIDTEIDCGAVPDPPNGVSDVNGTGYGGMVEYACYSGYQLVGDATRRCTKSGQWSGNDPQCEELLPQMNSGSPQNSSEEPSVMTETDPTQSVQNIAIFSVLGVLLLIALCVLLAVIVFCGFKWKLSLRRTGQIQGEALSNPTYDGNPFFRLLSARSRSNRRKLSAPTAAPPEEPHYESASGYGTSQEYEMPASPYQIPLTLNRRLAESLPWDMYYVPTEEQRKSIIEGNITTALSDQSAELSSNVPTFFCQSKVYWRPASNSTSLYEQLARNKYREIKRDKIQMIERLGSGNFGNVEKGLWHSPMGIIQVAVKQLKENASESDKVKFLQEAAINGQFHHRNVVNLLGVVTVGEPVMIILELLINGDLRKYLIKQRPVPGEMVPPETPNLLLRFCQQVASGMEYLSRKAFVHRDLAARNVLVAEDRTCKIADFGLAKDLDDEQYYVAHGGQIPVKWTAPEALYYKKYSTASDVWSFGILMYEIWSLGHKPFEGYTNSQAIKKLDQGVRLSPPPGCPRKVYSLMIDCWNPVKASRPSFSSLLQLLNQTKSIDLECVLNSDNLEDIPQEAAVLGAPLEYGEKLFQDLSQAYIGQDFLRYAGTL